MLTADIPLVPEPDPAGAILERVGFNRRKAHASARDHTTFIGPEEIDRSGAVRVSQLLTGVQDIRVHTEASAPVVYSADGRCMLNFVLDRIRLGAPGVLSRAPNLPGMDSRTGPMAGGNNVFGDLDATVNFPDLIGVEVYPRPQSVPQEFSPTQGPLESDPYQVRATECGTIVLWTRRMHGR
jgi:hypothetical protein